MEKNQTTSQLLFFRSRQEDKILHLETKEIHVYNESTPYISTETIVHVEHIEDSYEVTFGKLFFRLNSEDYKKLINIFTNVKNLTNKICSFEDRAFGFSVFVKDSGFIVITFENKVVAWDKFSRYIFADVVKYLEMMK